MNPTILMAGLNHTTAPVEIREQISAATCPRDQAQNTFLTQLDPDLFSEALLLSTCNRTELYTVARDRDAAEPALRRLFTAHESLGGTVAESLYIHENREAAAHLFGVASGLDSMILGEFEILGQVRRAYETARQKGTVGPILHQLFQQALRVGKRARTETRIGSGATSVASAAVAMARRMLGDLSGRSALVIGAGEMGRRAANMLVQDHACTVIVANRTLAHAAALASRIGCGLVPFEALGEALQQADLVISATKAPHLILDLPTLAAAAATRTSPLYLIDIAVPRDIDPRARSLPNVHLDNIDDLQDLVAVNSAIRGQAVREVQALLEPEVECFWDGFLVRRAAPALAALRKRAEQIRQAEVEKVLRRLEHLDLGEREQEAVTAMSASLVNRLLAAPTSQLKARVESGDGQAYLDLFCELFDLEMDTGEPEK